MRSSAEAGQRPSDALPASPGAPGRIGAAWIGLAALLGVLACAGWWLPPAALDWQPDLAGRQPWRALTAVAVHYSALHLAANLAGAALVGALGWAAALPPRCALAWALAWPLTQLGLLLQPELAHYGGLSGVLHAGVAVAGLHLAWQARGRRRSIGIAVLAVMTVKLVGESPWGAPLRHPAGWDIAVAPLAHTTGAIAGLFGAALVEAWTASKP